VNLVLEVTGQLGYDNRYTGKQKKVDNMADENKRLDLSGDLDQITNDLLSDVKAATEEVKQRRAADKVKDQKNAEKEKDRKISVLIIVAAALVLIVIAYFVMNGRQDAQQANTYTPPPTTERANVKINPRSVTGARPQAPARPMGQDSQQAHPQNEPEQPSQDSGM